MYNVIAPRSPQRLARLVLLVLLVAGSIAAAPPARAADAILYVNAAATGSGDGSSWADAYPQLSSALTAASAGDQIWVAAGTYRPTTTADRSVSFTLKSGVAIYGGFAGTETLLAQRDWTTNVVTLSGDLLGNDVGFVNSAENSLHVVTGATGATLDGVTITGGNTSLDEAYPPLIGYGGGMLNRDCSNLVLANLIIKGNSAMSGGGMFNTGTTAKLTNVAISGNRAKLGAGIFSGGNETSTMLTDVTISGNTASQTGGGMYNGSSHSSMTRVTISGNTAGATGGGLFNEQASLSITKGTISGNSAGFGGGMHNVQSGPYLTDVTISANAATTGHGGGMLNVRDFPTLTNAAIISNTAATYGGGMVNSGNGATLTKVTISGNAAGTYGGGMANLDSDPVLTNVQISGNTAGTYGGGILNSGYSSTRLINVLITGNAAQISGGGISNGAYGGGSLTNVTISGNTAPAGGAITSSSFSAMRVRNSIIWGNSSAIAYDAESSKPVISSSLIQDSGGSAAWNGSAGADGGGNLDADPQFVTPVPAAPSSGGDLRLRFGSPAINAGSNTVADPGLPATDYDGKPRISHDVVDMGAYERQSPIIYVDGSAAGSGDGSSWANAYPQLTSAITAASAGDQIWVAAGTYRPTTAADRSASFTLKSGVAIYGGFAGTETLWAQRNWTANVVTLSGDLLGNDNGFANNAENSYHVVAGAAGAILDGVTITGGNANGSYPDNSGGGMINDNFSNPTLRNLLISGNASTYSGGGIFNRYGSDALLTNVTLSGNIAGSGGGVGNHRSSPRLTNVTIISNTAESLGGGLFNDNSSPRLTNVTISENTASSGGGVMNGYYCNPVFTNVTISGNAANIGGGMANYASFPVLTNVLISGNAASVYGGAMDNQQSDPIITNATISGNTAPSGGGMVNWDWSDPRLRNTIIWANSSGISNTDTTSIPAISHSLVQGSGGSAAWNGSAGADGGGNLDADPLFVTPVPAAPSVAGDLRLHFSSPAINTGSATVTNPSLPATDRAGNPRIVGPTVDLGAYESATSPIYVKAGATGSGDGSSWANAYPQLSSALAAAGDGDQIWVAAGTYRPTTNGDRSASFMLEDSVAIYGGFSGIETMLTQRDWNTNVVTLSGDLLGNDSGFVNNDENSYHVISTHIFADDAIIDGLTISGGNASGINGAGEHALGGGIYDSSINHRLTLTNVTISGNQAFNGGGIYNDRSTLILSNVTISGNTAVERGGGIYNAAYLPLTNVTISGNKARYGGGLFLGGYSPSLINVVISGNTATEQGGGVYMSDWSPVLTNVTISGNRAQPAGGGAIFNNTITPPSIRNSIIWGNSSGISNSGTTTPPISYSLVQDSGGSAAWNGSAGADGGGNLDADPLFVTPVPSAPSVAGDLHLLPNSPGIDSGSNAVSNPGLPATDRDGDPRIANGVVNMGAYEALGWFTSQPPAAASYGSAYSHTFSASMPGQPGPVTFALTAGTLPPGLSLGPGGVLSGTPRAAGSYLGLAITASSGSSSYTQRFTLTVARAPLTITANDASRSYGQANPGFTSQVSGFVLGDDASVLSSWIQYSTPATGASPVGSYPITPSGTTAANYAITFVPGALTVTPAPLTITANDATRPYGRANPAFTSRISGFVLGDDASVLSSPIQFSTPATDASPVGSYPITPSGAAAANYAITFVPGALTVTPAPLTITANDATRPYGQANPAFTARISGFVLGDDASVLSSPIQFSTPATDASPVGSYPITPSGAAAANYAITFVPGALTVTAPTSTTVSVFLPLLVRP